MKVKKFGTILLIVAAILIGGSVWYINDYYPVDVSVSLEKASEYTPKKVVYGDEDSEVGFIFYPGGKVQFEAYAPLLEKLSQNQMFCVLVHMPANLAILDTHALDQVIEEYPNVKHWYVGGHSLGGSAACMCLDTHGDNFSGLILLGSYSTKDLSKTELSVLSIYGSEDGVLNRKAYEKNKNNLPKNMKEYIIQGGNHANFGNYGDQKGDGTATISREEQQEITIQQIIQFIQEVSK